jgi:hypothetical protein
MSDAFARLPADIVAHVDAWKAAVFDAAEPQAAALPCGYGDALSDFDSVLVVRMLRPDKLIPAVRLSPRVGMHAQTLSCSCVAWGCSTAGLAGIFATYCPEQHDPHVPRQTIPVCAGIGYAHRTHVV